MVRRPRPLFGSGAVERIMARRRQTSRHNRRSEVGQTAQAEFTPYAAKAGLPAETPSPASFALLEGPVSGAMPKARSSIAASRSLPIARARGVSPAAGTWAAIETRPPAMSKRSQPSPERTIPFIRAIRPAAPWLKRLRWAARSSADRGAGTGRLQEPRPRPGSGW